MFEDTTQESSMNVTVNVGVHLPGKLDGKLDENLDAKCGRDHGLPPQQRQHRYLRLPVAVRTGLLPCLLIHLCILLPFTLPLHARPASVTAKRAMVVSAHPVATDVGVRILRSGGNSADAAVAVHFALAVVYPNAGNLGGGGFFLWRSADGSAMACDFRETAPLRARRDMFLDSAGNPITKASLEGHRASGVPGSVAGMWEVHRRLGRLDWHACLQPAIGLAEKGFRVTARQAAELNRYRDAFTTWNGDACAFVSRRPWRAGMVLRQTELARTLQRIRDRGPDGFYAGETAALLVKEMDRGGGLITAQDLAGYRPVWRPIVRGNFRGHSVLTMPPPSSGGVALLQLLTMWEQQTKASIPSFHSADHVHLMAECERRVYA
ncbi:MAG: gamma-glutamyltransferase, partial [Candidatus Kapaibacterium sp.]